MQLAYQATQISRYTSLRNRRWKSSLQEDRLSPLEFRFKPISRSETIDRDIRRVCNHLRSAAQLQNHRSVPFETRETIARVIVAFPSIGCGQLGFDPNTIAQHMIAETHQNLKHAIQSSLTVSFVLLPDQQKIYDAFINQLNVCRLANDAPINMPFEKQSIPTNARRLSIAHYVVVVFRSSCEDTCDRLRPSGLDRRCQTKVQDLARSASHKVHGTDRTDMADWSQSTVQKYYEYCLNSSGDTYSRP